MPARYSPSPEFALVAACCRWPDDASRRQAIWNALQQPLDWTLVSRVIQRHRVAGLVQHGLHPHAAELPPELLARLNTQATMQLRTTLQLAAESKRVIDLLRQAGVKAMVIKGAPLSVQAFGNLTLRHSKDCDIAIEPHDIERAAAVVEAAGYRRHFPPPSWTINQLAPVRNSLKDFEYTHATKGLQLELQWRMTRSGHQWPEPWHVEKAEDVEISPGIVLPAMPEDNLLLYLCVHAAVHTWFRLKWLADIHALLAQGGPGAGEQLLQRARAKQLDRMVGATLDLCSIVLGAPSIPQQGMSVARRMLVQESLNAQTAGGGASEPEDVRFGTTRLAMSQYLTHRSWRYLSEQLMVDLSGLEPTSPAEPMWQRLLLRIPRWTWRRLRHAGRKRASA